MKKLFRSVLAVAVAATAMTSCQKAVMEEEGGINAVVSFQASFPETKTTFGTAEAGKYPVLWQDGDKVAVSVSLTNPLKDLEVTPSTDKKTGTFSKDVTLPGEGPWAFYVMSPSAAMVNASSSYKSLTLDFATDQTPTAVSVDPAAQVLLAMATATTIPTEPVPVTFGHLAAYGKVSLSNLPTSAKVTGLSLAFDQPVTGRWYFYPEEEDVTKRFKENAPSNLVNLTTEKTADVFFAVAPNGVAVKSVKVTLKTEDGNYEKEVTVPEKTFKSGVVSAFTVDMTGASKVQDKVFKLVKNVANLAAGDQVIIANKAATSAISTTQQSNNRKAATITPDANGDIVNPSAAVQILTVAAGATTGTFAFSPEAGMYLYAVKGKNYLRTKDALEADGSFTVAIADDGEATVTCTIEGEARILMHNSSSDLFACYTSGQKPIAIYKMESTTPPAPKVVDIWVNDAAGSQPVDGGAEAKSDDWLSYSGGTATWTANTTNAPRTKTLELADGAKITVTQLEDKDFKGTYDFTSKIFCTDGFTTAGDKKTITGVAFGEPLLGETLKDGNNVEHKNVIGIDGLYHTGIIADAAVDIDYEAKSVKLGVFLDGRKAQKDANLTGEYQYVAFLPGVCASSSAGSFAKPWTFCNPDLGTPDYEWLWFETDDLVTFTYSCAKVAQKLSTTGYSSTPYILGICVNVFKAEDATSTKTKGNYNVVYQFNTNNGNVGLQFKKTGPYVPKPDDDPKTVEEVLTKAGKNPANYEKLPFWYTKNAWYQSTVASNYMKLQTATSGGNFNKFVATNILCKGEIPNGSVVVSMGGDYGYRPEGWVDDKTKTATRPDRTSVQVTEVNDAWWTSGSQTFGYRAFNLDKGVNNLTDAEMEEVIEKFAVFVPKTTKALPNPDAVFTTAGYKLDDYTKLELTYNKYAFYNSTDATKGGVIQNKENVPTATNLGQFVATGIIDKANIPNGSVLVVCDGYQYRPEGWQVKGEKNTADRPGNVTTATVVVDDAWWGNFNCRAFNLAYAGNPGIPVTEMDHVIASFAIYVPKADPDPTHIDTAEKLVAFLKAATAETTTDYIMTKDVDMKGVTVPTAAGFKGTFDGKGKTIKNLAATAPLFATLDGTVKDVTLEGAFTPTGGTFGVLAGTSSGSIEGVTNKATVTLSAEDLNAETLIAGIVGNSTGTIKNCTNSGAVTVSSALSLANVAVAGVVAKASGALESVYNNGDVSVSTLYCVARPSATIEANPVFAPCVGGILGIAVSGTTITTGKNTGKVTFIASKIETLSTANVERVMIGGVAGAPAGNITSVDNEGDVLVQAITSDRTAATKGFITCVGGISGGDYYAGASQSLTNITNCTNAGKITVDTDANASNSAIGGIVGWPGVEGDTQNTLTKNCINNGAVTVSGVGKCRIGGIAGGAGSLEACKNYGKITSNLVGASGGTLGGVLGYSAKLVVGTVTNCESYGDVICNDTLNQTYVGALIGAHGSPNDFATDPAKIVGGIINCNIVVKGDQKYVGFAMGRYNGGGKSGRYMSLGTAESPVVIKGGSITLGETKTALTSENYKPFLAGTERACVVKVAGEDDVVIGSGSNSDRRPIYVKWEP